ncbi:MAG: histidine phosphatase family protein [Candidatus Azambacteria bacterium]|nr:histidine phosphatase family protein [Candidatus Azambacteria bacterium]
MRRLYLVRHGETEANSLKIIQGQSKQQLSKYAAYGDDLNPKGIMQARLLGKTLASVKFQYIYTSCALRAYNTADIVTFHNMKNALIIEEGLLEIDHGTFEGMRADEIAAKYPKLYKFYHTKPSQFIFPHGERMIEAKERVGKIIDRILRHRSFTENALVVSHGGTISLALIHIFGMDMDKMYHAIRHHNCAISIIEWSSPDTQPRIERLNDINHLKPIYNQTPPFPD